MNVPLYLGENYLPNSIQSYSYFFFLRASSPITCEALDQRYSGETQGIVFCRHCPSIISSLPV